MTGKQKIYDQFWQLLNDKIKALQKVLAELKESGSNETKSTAGDKHETALAMLQIEQANTGAQLNELLAQKAVLGKIDPVLSAPVISNGSLVKTNRGYFFVSTALGRITTAGITVTAVSPQSPLGLQLMGLRAGASVTVNTTSYLIETIE